MRETIKASGPIPAYEHWQAAITDDVIAALGAGDRETAHGARLRAVCSAGIGATTAHHGGSPMSATARGRVSIVGAGPGDPELITVRALARIRTAEVLVYDRLVDPALVEEAPRTAERVFAGKARGFAALEQHEIEALLIARALAGKHVVRLKGGDPYVFGRGGEEVAALVAAGIPVEVVPGVSSALAVPASAGIPVTHRELSSSLTIVTGHEDPTKPEAAVDWDWLAASQGTLVILMGLSQLPGIRDRLIAGGRSPETPGGGDRERHAARSAGRHGVAGGPSRGGRGGATRRSGAGRRRRRRPLPRAAGAIGAERGAGDGHCQRGLTS